MGANSGEKPGWQTSEFWLTAGTALAAIAVLGGWIRPGEEGLIIDGVGRAVEHAAALATMAVTVWRYIASREGVKAAEAVMRQPALPLDPAATESVNPVTVKQPSSVFKG